MNRKVLLIEPNYKAKYPPLHLMKISRYYREVCKDDVRFFKGDLKKLAAELLLEEFFYPAENEFLRFDLASETKATELFGRYEKILLKFIQCGDNEILNAVPKMRGSFFEEILISLRKKFQREEFPKFNIICVGTLFTFAWTETIKTINTAKKFLLSGGKIFVGGIAATLVPEEMQADVGDEVKIHIGLLKNPDDLDKDDDVIIDSLTPDYSILEEVGQKYFESDAYFGYTTRGCIRHCEFCAVTTLEPEYKNYVDIREQLRQVEEQFGAKQNLLLMDNNVLASPKFFQIIDDIKSCGFGKNSTYTTSSEYDIAIKNLRAGFNERVYVRKIIRLYDALDKKLPEEVAGEFYSEREKNFLLYPVGATKEKIFDFDSVARPLFEKFFRRTKKTHHIDFNQGLDARLLDDVKMSKLAEINIRPLRIAFDHYEQKNIYERAIRLAAKHGIKNISNYMLYNFLDTPDDLYNRLKLNIELAEELNLNAYSFPMKYIPIRDPEYFRNRDYLGKHWNRKFIRSIQAIINATKGKIGRGRSFFEAAFGKNLAEFHDLLWMPEAMIIYRNRYKELAEVWQKKFHGLQEEELFEAKEIIKLNKFGDEEILKAESKNVREVLDFYRITRED